MTHFVCILASRPRGAIYIGSTRDLRQRVEQHQAGIPGSHTSKYNIITLVYFEQHQEVQEAANREKRIKRWPRKWKDDLVNTVNPDWADLCHQIPL
ncbi:MAG: GIY-YIG nuclease family protein [Roseibium sp.]|nr:GIY-YIG nuclease family protein [Roseibium sp.]